jgi:phosphoribosylformimino-5-aminoimidazole carboxamide ribotide isomerase
MEIIPVIDLLNGCVVHARHGDRQHYLPIRSSLCGGNEPLAIVRALLELYPFRQLYIADLDAIQKRGNHRRVVSDIQNSYPHLEIWLDAGLVCQQDLHPWHGLNVTWVIGSESLSTLNDYMNLKQLCGRNYSLSLDFAATGYEGPAELLHSPVQWPDTIIAMTLTHVGSNLGPDFALLTELRDRKPGQKIYAAGGVRHIQDLQQLKAMGIQGALVASALHTAEVSATELNGL